MNKVYQGFNISQNKFPQLKKAKLDKECKRNVMSNKYKNIWRGYRPHSIFKISTLKIKPWSLNNHTAQTCNHKLIPVTDWQNLSSLSILHINCPSSKSLAKQLTGINSHEIYYYFKCSYRT